MYCKVFCCLDYVNCRPERPISPSFRAKAIASCPAFEYFDIPQWVLSGVCQTLEQHLSSSQVLKLQILRLMHPQISSISTQTIDTPIHFVLQGFHCPNASGFGGSDYDKLIEAIP